MDTIDDEILHLLQQNARMSVSDISANVNLSVSAVSERIKKMEKAGLILQYTAILNSEAFGRVLTVYLMVEITAPAPKLKQYILEENDIHECHLLAGGSNAMLKVQTTGTDALNAITNKLHGFEQVGTIQAFLITDSPKQLYFSVPEIHES